MTNFCSRISLFLVGTLVQHTTEGLKLLPDTKTTGNDHYTEILNAIDGVVSGGVLVDSSWVLTAASKDFSTGIEMKSGANTIGTVDFVHKPSFIYDVLRPLGALSYNLSLLHLEKPYLGPIKPAMRARWITSRMTDVVIGSYDGDQKEIGQNVTWFSPSSPKRPFIMHFSPPETEGIPPFEAMISSGDIGSGVFWKPTKDSPYLLIGICSLIDPLYDPKINLYDHATFQAENLIGKSNTWIDNTIIAYALGGAEAFQPKSPPPPPPTKQKPRTVVPEKPISKPAPKIFRFALTAEVVEVPELLKNTGLYGSFVTKSIILTVPENTPENLKDINFDSESEKIKYRESKAGFILLKSMDPYGVVPAPLANTELVNLYEKEIYLVKKENVQAVNSDSLDLGKPIQILKVVLPVKSESFDLETKNNFSVSLEGGENVLSEGSGVFLKNEKEKYEICGIVLKGKVHFFTTEENTILSKSTKLLSIRS